MKALQTLITFILSELKVEFRKTESNKGFVLYSPNLVSPCVEKLTLLAKAVNPDWTVIEQFGKTPTYNTDGTKVPQSYYVGYAKSSNCTEEEAMSIDISS